LSNPTNKISKPIAAVIPLITDSPRLNEGNCPRRKAFTL
jgi:hypothetical protein